MAIGLDSGKVAIHDLLTGAERELETLPGNGPEWRALAFARGREILLGVSGHKLHVWHLLQEDMHWDMDLSVQGPILSATISGDGRLIAISSKLNAPDSSKSREAHEAWLSLFKIEDREVTIRDCGPFNYDKYRPHVAFSFNGRHVASASGRNPITVWDTNTGEETLAIAPGSAIRSIGLSDDFVAAGEDHRITLYDMRSATERVVARIEHPGAGNWSLAFSADGEQLVSGSYEDVRLWAIMEEEDVYSASGPVNSLTISPGDQRFIQLGRGLCPVRGCDTGHTTQWELLDATTGKAQHRSSRPQQFSPTGEYLITMDQDESGHTSTAHLWNGSMTEVQMSFDAVIQVAVSGDGQVAAVISPATIQKLVREGTRWVTQRTHDCQRLGLTLDTCDDIALEISPNNKLAAIGVLRRHRYAEDRLILFDLDSGSTAWEGACWRKWCFSPVEELIAIEQYDLEDGEKWVVLLETGTGTSRAELRSPAYMPRFRNEIPFVFSKDSRQIAIGEDDGVAIVDTLSGQVIRVLETQHSKYAQIIETAFSPAGTIAAVEIADTGGPYVHLWDGHTGDLLGRRTKPVSVRYRNDLPKALPNDAQWLSFSDDSRYLLSKEFGKIPLTLWGAEMLPQVVPEATQDCIHLDDEWLVQGSRNLLWMPPAYRPRHMDAFAVKDGVVVMAHRSTTGRITSFQVDLNATPSARGP